MNFHRQIVLARSVAVLCVTLVLPSEVLLAWQGPPPPPPQGQQAPPDGPMLAPEQLNDLVAPVALYADPLLAQVLAASTYPQNVQAAAGWLRANRGLQGPALTDAAQQQNWDPSVQALIVFPSVVEMMDRNVQWTTELGNAFLAQEADVMDAVQRMRAAARKSGKLVSNPQMRVSSAYDGSRELISIDPGVEDSMYVPVYEPATIWGAPRYHPWGGFWYPPRVGWGTVLVAGALGFFVVVSARRYFHTWGGWHGWGWGPSWRGRSVSFNRGFYTANHYRGPVGYSGTRWAHDPGHRGGIAYGHRGVTEHYRTGHAAPPPIRHAGSGRPVNVGRPGGGPVGNSRPAGGPRAGGSRPIGGTHAGPAAGSRPPVHSGPAASPRPASVPRGPASTPHTGPAATPRGPASTPHTGPGPRPSTGSSRPGWNQQQKSGPAATPAAPPRQSAPQARPAPAKSSPAQHSSPPHKKP